MSNRRTANEGLSAHFFIWHPVVWFIAATLATVVIGNSLWENHLQRFVQDGRFLVTNEKLKLEPTTHWFQNELDREFNEIEAMNISLLDSKTIPIVLQRIENLPFVDSVNRIEKSSSGLNVATKFRIPVALVRNSSDRSLFVDSDGVVFDHSVLNTTERLKMENDVLRISMPRIGALDNVEPWRKIYDARLEKAACLASFLLPHAKRLELYRIVTFNLSPEASLQNQFEIWTKNGTRVLWGDINIDEINRTTDTRKINSLYDFVAETGPLSKFGQQKTFLIDLRRDKTHLLPIERMSRATLNKEGRFDF